MSASRLSLALLAALAGCLAVAGLQDGPRERGEAALRAGDYPTAAARLAEALAAPGEGKDELLYLLAVAQARAGKPDDALAALDRLLAEFPASPLRMKAAFRKADVLAAKKDFAAAAAIYDERLGALLDPARRGRIAKVYVDVAREHLVAKDPRDPSFKAQPDVARGLLLKALELEALGADEEAARLDLVRAEAMGSARPEELLATCDVFEKKHPTSTALDEVLLARGDALAKLGRAREAERTWTRLAGAFPASKRAPEALARAAGLAGFDPLRHTLAHLRRLARDFAASEQAPDALLKAGAILSGYPDLHAEAVEAWRELATKHPKHALAPDALLAIAKLHAADGDDARAIEVHGELVKAYPESARWHEARQGIADLRYARIERARERKDGAALRAAVADFLDAHPGDPRAAQAGFLAADLLREEKKHAEAVEAFLALAARHPNQDEGHHARFAAARLIADELGDFERALKELDQVKGSSQASAQLFLHHLRRPGLQLSAERSFRAGEAPSAKLRVRNLEKVHFRLWAVDVRDYFEKKGVTAGLESLEVSVIAPDQEWDVDVAGYVRHKAFEFAVEIPRKEPGAYVVVASAGLLEAKTAVVVTDLGVLATGRARGVDVIVHDLKTGARVPDAVVRLAADGKLLKAWTAETRAKTVSVLAESKGHLAFVDLQVGGLAVPAERRARALILPERAIVAMGETVTVRIVVRDAAGGLHVPPPAAKKYRLEAWSGRNVLFSETELAFSRAGLATASFRVPHGVNQVQLRVLERAKPTDLELGRIEMPASLPRPPAADIDFLVDDAPVFAGDPVDVVAVVRDEGGRPRPDLAVQVRTPDSDDWKELRTGPDGAVRVTVRDTAQPLGGMAIVQVQADGLAESIWVPILPRDLAVTFENERREEDVLLVGEAKAIAFKAARADGEPVAREFRWAVRRGPGLPSIEGTATTGADGKGGFTFTPAGPGAHRIRIWRKEDDGVAHGAGLTLTVLEEKDAPRLELRSELFEFELGKPVSVTAISRVDRGTAYVVLEGEQPAAPVEVTLEKGRTVLTLAAPPPGVSEFQVSLLLARGREVHRAVRNFRVKAPELKLEAPKEAGPGEEVELKLTAAPGSEILVIAAPYLEVGLDPASFTRSLPAGAISYGSGSAALSFTGVATELDERMVNALSEMKSLDKDLAPRVMMPTELPAAGRMFGGMGAGGGGGGTYGQRFGGRRNLVARGGGGGDGKVRVAVQWAPAPPLLFAVLTAGPDGKVSARFRMPHAKARVEVAAWSLDAGTAIGRATADVKTRAGVTAEARLPESVVEGEKTSAVVLLTNHAKEAKEATLRFEGVEAKVAVPARTVLEHRFEWTGAAKAAFALDGVARELTSTLRRPPSAFVEAGGAFAARTEIAVDGAGKLYVRYATGPEALLESLAQGEDPLFRASGASARLLALVARHRFAASTSTKSAVLDFAARRAEGLQDAAATDASWVPLLTLAGAEAKSAGFEIAFDGSLAQERFSAATHDDVKALLLLALARGGEAQYGYVHRLWRGAEALSPRALAAVALSLKALDKADEAKEAVARLARLVKEDRWEAPAIAAPDASNTPFVATALAAWALAEIEPASPLLPKARAWLLGRAPASAAERAYLALALQSTPDRSRVTALRIDGRELAGFGEVEAARAVVEPVGEGTFYALARRESGPAPALAVGLSRTVGWPTLFVEGQRVREDRTTAKEPVENPSMSRVAAGQGFLVHWELTVKGPTTQYAVVELPRPTGLRMNAAQLRILLEPQEAAERKRRVSVWAYADAPGSSDGLEVLAPGSAYREGWTPTHAQRAAAGAILYEAKKWKEAKEMLAPLFEKGALDDRVAVDAARRLAYAGVELGESATVVRYFEILKEKAPQELVPFDRIRAVGKAYAATKEPVRAMQIFQGTGDAYFLQEAGCSGALEGLGRTRAAADEMRRLLMDFADTDLVRSMHAGFGMRLVSAASAAPGGTEKDAQRLSKSELLAVAVPVLERFRAWHPEDAEGDKVALTLATAHLEGGKPDLAERSAREAAARFPKSRLLDAFDYTLAYAEFAQRKYVEALAMCERLESFDYGPDSNPGPGVMRDRAILMKAQIHHAKGEIDRALENYKKVKETSPDAAMSAAFLEREALAVPETTVSPTARPAEIELEYSGVAEATVKAYRVDLAVLALRRRDLGGAGGVEVAGIKPAFERTYKLDVPNARRREKQKLALELPKPGAYVVSVKAGDFSAGGLLLRSDLALAVQDDGQWVRANLTDVKTGAFAEGVKVTIFWSQGGAITTTRSDLRGIAEAQGREQGRPIVVAEKDGHVAAYRGAVVLAVPKAAEPSKPQVQQQAGEALQEKLRQSNEQLERNYFDNLNRQQQGVEMQRTGK